MKHTVAFATAAVLAVLTVLAAVVAAVAMAHRQPVDPCAFPYSVAMQYSRWVAAPIGTAAPAGHAAAFDRCAAWNGQEDAPAAAAYLIAGDLAHYAAAAATIATARPAGRAAVAAHYGPGWAGLAIGSDTGSAAGWAADAPW